MFELIRANKRRAFILMAAMAALLGALGYGLGLALWHRPLEGLVVAFVIWAVLAFVTWFQGDALILQASGARRIEQKDHPVLFNVVEEMTIAAGLPKTPEVYILDVEAPNAFATGRSPEKAKIAVTAGLLERLNRDELQGVIGHEIGHVANRDVLYMMVATIMIGAIVMLADIGFYSFLFGGGTGGRRTSAGGGGGQAQAIMMLVALVLVILAPILAQLFYFALSRRREYLADASSARYTRYPEGLASALEKIAANTTPMPQVSRATAALYIANPLKTSARGLSDLSSTHPPITERIRILRSMSSDASYASYDKAFKNVSGRAVGVVPFSAARESDAVQTRAASDNASAAVPSRASRRRDTTNALWSAQGYRFIDCPCGVRLKVPPRFPKDVVTCPNCGRDHSLKH
ncbi:MAG TPA: M48 family metallopeptidase [Gammaproteobacteria bacterium]|nr:M48 family metallopeptidase [Gammaproteobacteria bacterium]